jgi:hypothetical protein
MADFHELVKSVNRVRSYVRDFFISGWRSRLDRAETSQRSYDNEKKRITSWFGERYVERRNVGGRRIFSLSVDMNDLKRNPMYEVWRAKRFLPNDLSLHFFIMDLLSSGEAFTFDGVTDEISLRYGKEFESATVRGKLKEYVDNGILSVHKEGNRQLYSLCPLSWKSLPDGVMDAVDFFTEAAPLGVIGSFIQDEAERENRYFRFKHSFIVHTLEDEVLLGLLDAIHERAYVTLDIYSGDDDEKIAAVRGTPLRILSSVQGGRRYVAMKEIHGVIVRRLDRIYSVRPGGAALNFGEMRKELDALLEKTWGVMFENDNRDKSPRKLERVEMRLSIDENREKHVLDRLMRERRNGTVEREGKNVFVYRNNVWNSREMLPFVKSFTGRILSFECDNEDVERTFRDDMEKMAEIYGGEEGSSR